MRCICVVPNVARQRRLIVNIYSFSCVQSGSYPLNSNKTIDEYNEVYNNLRFAVSLKDDSNKVGYVYLLRGVCLLKLLELESENESTKTEIADKARINEIYKCFRIAKRVEFSLSASDLKVIDRHIQVIQINSGIEYSDEWRKEDIEL